MAADPILDLHRGRNASTAAFRDSMTPHRNRVMREILRIGLGGRLCVLGAGNSNDLELGALVEHFDEVHLVDIDEAALNRGMTSQGVSSPRIRLHGGVDFAGLSAGANAADVETRAATFRAHVDALGSADVPRDCDVVVSACVVSQLADGLLSLYGAEAPGIHALVLDVRNRHFDLVVERTKPGGSALLVVDVVSSDTAPALLTTADHGLTALRDELIRAHNFFHGTNPYAIAQYVSNHHGAAIARLERRPPWRWAIGQRAFLVTALRIEKRA